MTNRYEPINPGGPQPPGRIFMSVHDADMILRALWHSIPPGRDQRERRRKLYRIRRYFMRSDTR